MLLSSYSSCPNLIVILCRSSTHSHLYQSGCLPLDNHLWGSRSVAQPLEVHTPSWLGLVLIQLFMM